MSRGAEPGDQSAAGKGRLRPSGGGEGAGGEGAGGEGAGGKVAGGEGAGAPGGEEPWPQPLRPAVVLRVVLPAFVASTLVALIGVVLVLTGHRTVGLVIIAVGALGGLVVRMRLVTRAQQQRRPPP
jgi:hypothetical protein